MTGMHPSQSMTDEQIAVITGLVAKGLRESNVPRDIGQLVITSRGEQIAERCIADFERHVEVRRNSIVVRVQVDRTLDPTSMINAMRFIPDPTNSVPDSMPRGEGSEVEVTFFKPPCGSDNYLAAEREEYFEALGLKPADPYSLAAANKKDPNFSKLQPNITHWLDDEGALHFMMVETRPDGRHVVVGKSFDEDDCPDVLWLAGIPK